MINILKRSSYAFCISLLFFCCNQNKEHTVSETERKKHEERTDSIDPVTKMIVDSRYNIVRANCLNCHSSTIIVQNRATREGWDKMITWMQAKQGLWDLGNHRSTILDYLAEHYGIEKKHGRRPLLDSSKIEWYRLNIEKEKNM